MSPIFDAYGHVANVAPTASPSTEARVNAELASSFDPLLHIMWVPIAYFNERRGRWEGRYALMHKWRDNDPRWAELGADYPEAHDRLGWFCSDMHDASTVPIEPDQMMERVRDLLGKADNTRFPWRDRMLRTIESNAARRAAVRTEALDEVVDMAATEYYHTSKAARVFQSTPAGGVV